MLSVTPSYSQKPIEDTLFATQVDYLGDCQFQVISGYTAVGYLNTNNHFIWNDVDFGSGADSVDIRLIAHPDNLGPFVVTIDGLDGDTILTYTPTSTGDWYTYEIQKYPLTYSVLGIHDLYVKSLGYANGNIHWMLFYRSSLEDTDPDKGLVIAREGNTNIDESMHTATFNNSQYIKQEFFTAVEDYTLTEIRTMTHKIEEPNCVIYVSLHEALDSTTIGPAISTGEDQSTNLPASAETYWHSWDMTPILIEQGKNYCIQMRVSNFSDPNKIIWMANADVALDYYLMYSYDDGVTFGGPELGNDYMFEMYGWSGPDLRQDVGITWNASTDNVGVTGYNIWVDAEYFDTSIDTVYTLKLNPGVYVVAVSAFDAAGNESALSESIIVTIKSKDPDPPTVPENLMEIIPNPAIQAFNVILKRALVENSKFQILSPTGKIIFEREVIPGETIFTIDEILAKGIYILALIENGKRIDNTHLVIV